MKLGFVIPIVGPAVSGAPGLSAFCRGLEGLGHDTLWVGDRLVTAAAVTSRMRLNASTFYYEPPHLARLLTTLGPVVSLSSWIAEAIRLCAEWARDCRSSRPHGRCGRR